LLGNKTINDVKSGKRVTGINDYIVASNYSNGQLKIRYDESENYLRDIETLKSIAVIHAYSIYEANSKELYSNRYIRNARQIINTAVGDAMQSIKNAFAEYVTDESALPKLDDALIKYYEVKPKKQVPAVKAQDTDNVMPAIDAKNQSNDKVDIDVSKKVDKPQ
jgi:hypothetical protein